MIKNIKKYSEPVKTSSHWLAILPYLGETVKKPGLYWPVSNDTNLTLYLKLIFDVFFSLKLYILEVNISVGLKNIYF